jgi:hypothetical protein
MSKYVEKTKSYAEKSQSHEGC